MSSLITGYNPDVLSCLANLSNDEVFTPPEVANAMLNMLPQELFADPNTRFLDPACKSGVFLREIAKRCLAAQLPGYKEAAEEISGKKRDGIPLTAEDNAFHERLQETIDHIFHDQVFGIAITELTSLLARRSLYCTKYPNSDYSVSRFADPSGNVRYKRIRHRWKDGKCVFCGASEKEYARSEELETHAYELIHTTKPEDIFKMKFDVIISNPPYQLSTGGSGVQATPIYNRFIQQAKRLQPRYISMIVPSRWFSGGFGLDSFRNEMLHDTSIRVIHDYPEASDCFSGVQIKGGVCYFLWDRDNKGDCAICTHKGNSISPVEVRPLLEEGCDTFIRYNIAVDILRKVRAIDGDRQTMDSIVSSQKPFGLGTKYKGNSENVYGNDGILIYGSTGKTYASRSEIDKLSEMIDQYKVFISAAGSGSDTFPHAILAKPFFGDKQTACSETYVVIGPFDTVVECENAISYIQTKLFRFLVMLRKPTQHALKKVYGFVPVLDFLKTWTDEELYSRYSLSHEEISFIESMIKPMTE